MLGAEITPLAFASWLKSGNKTLGIDGLESAGLLTFASKFWGSPTKPIILGNNNLID